MYAAKSLDRELEDTKVQRGGKENWGSCKRGSWQ